MVILIMCIFFNYLQKELLKYYLQNISIKINKTPQELIKLNKTKI